MIEDESHLPIEQQSLSFRLQRRADIRRANDARKSVQEGRPDRLSLLLEEAAVAVDRYQTLLACAYQAVSAIVNPIEHDDAEGDSHDLALLDILADPDDLPLADAEAKLRAVQAYYWERARKAGFFDESGPSTAPAPEEET